MSSFFVTLLVESGSLLNRESRGEIIHSIGCKLILDPEVLAPRIAKIRKQSLFPFHFISITNFLNRFTGLL
jgi:hypothetical protein